MREVSIERIFNYFIKIIPYLKVTMTYVLISLVVGFSIGSLICKMKMSRNKLANLLATFYLTITRCTPSIVLLLLIFYGLPAIIKEYTGVNISGWEPIIFACMTFSIFIGASSSEIIRSGYESINKGQWEAGLSGGLSEFQTFRRIILPQLIQRCLPNIGNTVIFLIKEGALVYTIGLKDVFGGGFYLAGQDMNAYVVDMYIALAFIYWPVTVIMEKLFSYLEKSVQPGHRKQKRGVLNES